MVRQLPIECLDEILENLEDDIATLYSCLLVNRLWCRISVRILWRNWDFDQFDVRAKSVLGILIACLPNESKELLYENKIFFPTPTSKPPLFNYPTFCKVLSIYNICELIYQSLGPYKKRLESLVTNEIIKMFINHISLKKLIYSCNSYNMLHRHRTSFTYFSEMRDLSELYCSSNLSSKFFYHLSQKCHNLQSLSIKFYDEDFVSNELKELISLQNDLKNLTLSAYETSWTNIIPALTKNSNIVNTVTKLHLYSDCHNNDLPILLSFVSLFTNLQEIIFSFFEDFGDFDKLQYINFPKLQILKIPFACPKPEYLMKFLENNGKTLKKLDIGENNDALSLSIANSCPNLKSFFTVFNSDELDILKTIFINCQYLESIKIVLSGEERLTKEVLETVAIHSPKNFCELKISHYSYTFYKSTKELESFFICWKNRTSKKLLKLIFIDCSISEENMKIIKKYENLGIIKLMTKSYEEEQQEEEVVLAEY